MKLTIAIDVDLTVVDSLRPWLEEFESVVGVPFPRHRDVYHLGPVMLGLAKERGVEYDPAAFWKRPDLYDNMVPLDNAVRSINTLKFLQHDLVFVTSCFNEHVASKQAFCRRHFGDIPFISTFTKEYVDFDVLIDDNDEVMEACAARRPEALLIQPTDVVSLHFDLDETLRFNPECWFMIPELVYEYANMRYTKTMQSTIKEFHHA